MLTGLTSTIKLTLVLSATIAPKVQNLLFCALLVLSPTRLPLNRLVSALNANLVNTATTIQEFLRDVLKVLTAP